MHSLEIQLITDGSVYKNPGNGGWAFVVRYEDRILHEEYDFYRNTTTNNEMELYPILRGLRWIIEKYPDVPRIRIRSDSQFIINLLREYWGCVNPNINDMAVEFWDILDQNPQKKIYLEKVKGHSGDIDNERANTLAEMGRLQHPNVQKNPALQHNPYSKSA